MSDVSGLGENNLDYWEGKGFAIEFTGGSLIQTYYTKNIQPSDTVSANISGTAISVKVQAEQNGYTPILCTIPLSDLAKGKYTLTLNIGSRIATREITIYPANKFIVTNAYAYWDDTNTFALVLTSPNSSDNHDYEVELFNLNGTKISGITCEKPMRYEQSIYLFIHGLNYETSMRMYYIKVTDKNRTDGEAYGENGETKYFVETNDSNKPGKLITIHDTPSSFSYYGTSTCTYGVIFNHLKLPGVLNFHVPYNTDSCVTRTITSNMVNNNGGYFFSQELINELPDKDALYDVTFVDSNGFSGIIRKKNITAYTGVSTPVTSISVTPKTASLSKGDTIQLHIIYTPSNANSGTGITWTSLSENIASVDNKGLVTAKGKGTTTITATTSNGKSATCTIKVTDLSTSIASVNLYLNQVSYNSTSFTVSGYNAAPVIKSLNTSIATVKTEASGTDAKKVTVYATGTGTTAVRITADGVTKDIPVTVGTRYTVKSVSFNKTVLNMSIGGNPQTLIATVNPKEAASGVGYTWEYAPEGIVSVDELSPEKKKLTAQTKGTTTVTVKAEVDGKICGTASCVIHVKDTYSESEITNMRNAFSDQLLAITNKDEKLASVSINAVKPMEQEGTWSWDEPNTVLAADNKAPIQYFSATFLPTDSEKESFSTLLPVAVSKVTGIAGKSGNVAKVKNTIWGDTFTLSYIGSDKVLESTRVKPSWLINGTESYVKFVLSENKDMEGYTVSFNAIGGTEDKEYKQSLTMKAAIDGGSTVKKDCFTLNKTVIIPKSDCIALLAISVNKIQPAESKCIAFDKIIQSKENTYGCENIHVDLVNVTKDSNKIKLTAIAQDTKGFVNNPKLTWTSSDKKVAAVSGTSGEGTLTLKKAGKTVITVKSKDKGGISAQIILQVLDQKPIVSKTSFTINQYKDWNTELRGAFQIFSQSGTKIKSISVSEGTIKSNDIEMKMMPSLTNASFCWLGLCDNYVMPNNQSSIKKNLTINIVTDNGTYTQPIKVTIESKKPTVKIIKRSAANVFYTEPVAVMNIKSEQKIDNIYGISVSENAFEIASKSERNNVHTLHFEAKENRITKSNYGDFLKKDCAACYATIKVEFQGYKDTATQTLKIKIPVMNKKLSIKTQDTILYPGMTSSAISFVNQEILPNTIQVSSNSTKVNFSKNGNDIVLTNRGLKKTEKIKITLSDAAWTQDVNVNNKVVLKSQKPALKLTKSKMILNTAANVQTGETITSGISVKGNSAAVEDIMILATGKNAALIKNEYLYVGFDKTNQTIKVGLNKGNRGNIKKGTYQVKLKGKACEGTSRFETGEVMLTLSITDQTPSVKLVKSGSIDLLNRSGTAIYYIPKLKNMQADLLDVSATGSGAKYFTYEVVNGKIKVQAKSNIGMYTNKKYLSTLTLSYDNGRQLSVPISIKPKQSKVILTKEYIYDTVYRKKVSSDINSCVYFATELKSIGTIDRFEMAQNKNWKFFISDISKSYTLVSGTISLNTQGNSDGSANLVKPGTYKLPYYVYLKDGAVNVGPKKITITVKVK